MSSNKQDLHRLLGFLFGNFTIKGILKIRSTLIGRFSKFSQRSKVLKDDSTWRGCREGNVLLVVPTQLNRQCDKV